MNESLLKIAEMVKNAESNTMPVAKSVGIAIAAIAAIAFFSPSVSINGSNFGSINQTIVNNGNVPLVNYSDLAKDAQIAFKKEACLLFPQINDIGKGVDWQPVTDWMMNVKHIKANSTRDLFRSGCS